MTSVNCPDGVTVSLHYYLISAEEIEVRLSVGELPVLPQMSPQLDIKTLPQMVDLEKVGTGWRVMTREEIADYRRRDIEGDDE
jgi:hypothetical protein